MAGLAENRTWAWVWPEHRSITKNEILGELQAKTAIPGVLPTFLQPIQTLLVAASGGFIMLVLWDVNLSVAVWVGFLVLFGVVDDDSVILSTYLERISIGRHSAPRTVPVLRSGGMEMGTDPTSRSESNRGMTMAPPGAAAQLEVGDDRKKRQGACHLR